MNVTINPGKISGTITPPPSKSITQRVYAAALLHHGKTIIQNAGSSSDETAALNIIQALGATVDCISDDNLVVKSNGIHPTGKEINCGESGLAARLFIPIAATIEADVTINGTGSLLNRPMNTHIETLLSLGLEISSNNGCLPITIKGKLQPKNISVDGSLSSQFLSGLLIAYSFTTEKETTVQVKDLVSQPYIDLTLQTLEYYGKKIANSNYEHFTVSNTGELSDNDVFYYIENDWSAAAALLVAGAISGEVTVEHILQDSLQADKAVLDVLSQVGAKLDVNAYSTTVQKDKLNAFTFDATNCPDLFPVLSILAAVCDGTSAIKGTNRLIHKESNRLESITEMLEKFGVIHQRIDDELKITGSKEIQAASINSHNDHRIVMAAALGSLVANGQVTIEGVEAVNKSYPDFFAHLSLLGAVIEES